MAFTLADIATLTKTLTVRFPGTDKTLTVVYNPNALTPRQEKAFQAAIKDEEPAEAVLLLLSRLLVRWDLQSAADSPPLPTDYATLLDVPSPILKAVMEAIGEANTADPTKPATSPATT